MLLVDWSSASLYFVHRIKLNVFLKIYHFILELVNYGTREYIRSWKNTLNENGKKTISSVLFLLKTYNGFDPRSFVPHDLPPLNPPQRFLICTLWLLLFDRWSVAAQICRPLWEQQTLKCFYTEMWPFNWMKNWNESINAIDFRECTWNALTPVKSPWTKGVDKRKQNSFWRYLKNTTFEYCNI